MREENVLKDFDPMVDNWWEMHAIFVEISTLETWESVQRIVFVILQTTFLYY